MGDESLKLKNQICHRLYVASNGITRVYRPFLSKLGLTYPQYVVMMALWEEDEITMGELAVRTHLDKGFLATMIEKMNQGGLVEVQQSEADLRKKFIRLTLKGKKLKQRAESIPSEIVNALSGKEVDPDRVQKFIEMLDEINSAIETYLHE